MRFRLPCLAMSLVFVDACSSKAARPLSRTDGATTAEAATIADDVKAAETALAADGATTTVEPDAIDAPPSWDTPKDTLVAEPRPDLPFEGLAPSCGDRVVDDGEQCDDGNTLSGDGCSSLCQLECGDAGVVVCPDSCFGRCGALCCANQWVTARCGDGRRTSAEGCDDGNTAAGDGCSGVCTLELGFRCVPGFLCAPICGDRMMKGGETCDDGNTSEGDGCSRYCLVEPGWDCTSGVCVRFPAVDGGGDSGTPVLYCGDGIRSGAEECDLGQSNSNSVYGGCSTQCMFVWCGDGILNGDEECDLGDKNGTDPYTKDGCTISCQKSHFCGDGIVDTNFGEDCDLGDRNGLTLDQEGRPSDSPSAGVWCTVDCAFPHYVFP